MNKINFKYYTLEEFYFSKTQQEIKNIILQKSEHCLSYELINTDKKQLLKILNYLALKTEYFQLAINKQNYDEIEGYFSLEGETKEYIFFVKKISEIYDHFIYICLFNDRPSEIDDVEIDRGLVISINPLLITFGKSGLTVGFKRFNKILSKCEIYNSHLHK